MGRIQDVDAVSKNRSTSVYGNCVSLSESPINEEVLYVGTDDGLVHMTRNGGVNWTQVRALRRRAGVHLREPTRGLASRRRARLRGVQQPQERGLPALLCSSARTTGASWRSIAANLPETDAVWSLAEDHENENLLFVGTEFGVYVSLDRGGKWLRMKSGLPTIAVRDIEIQRRENDLILGTFGRGFYVLDDYSRYASLSPELLARARASVRDSQGAALHRAESARRALGAGLAGLDVLRGAQSALRRDPDALSAATA